MSLRRIDGWVLVLAGLIWLQAASGAGWTGTLLAGSVGAVALATGVAHLLFPGDARIASFAALAGGAGLLVALLGMIGFGFATSFLLLLSAAGIGISAGRIASEDREVLEGVPTVSPSLAVAAKVGVDEAMLATFHMRFNYPAQAQRQGHARLALELRDYLGEQGFLDNPLAYHGDAPPPLEAKLVRERAIGIDYEHLSFESGWSPREGEPFSETYLGTPANRTAHAWVLRGDPSAPWLMCINGYRTGMPTIDLAAFPPKLLCDELRLNLVIPVLPLHGLRRTGRFSGDAFFDGDPVTSFHAEAQAMWDLRRIAGWMRSQGAEKMGVGGLSLGSYNAALFACIEDGLSCAIAGIPLVDFSRIMWTHGPDEVLDDYEEAGLTREKYFDMLRPISPLVLQPKVEAEGLAIFGGAVDRIVPPDHARDLMKHWEPKRQIWFEGGHLTFMHEGSVRALWRDTLRERMGPADSSSV